jgi:hypothetical protein
MSGGVSFPEFDLGCSECAHSRASVARHALFCLLEGRIAGVRKVRLGHNTSLDKRPRRLSVLLFSLGQLHSNRLSNSLGVINVSSHRFQTAEIEPTLILCKGVPDTAGTRLSFTVDEISTHPITGAADELARPAMHA